MEAAELNQRLAGIAQVVVSKYSLSASYTNMIVKSAKMALRAVTLNEYNQGHLEEMIRVLRGADKSSSEDEILKELKYEFAWTLSQKTIIPILQAEAIANEFYPIILQSVSDILYVHNIDSLLEYLEIERSLTNKKALKRQEVMENAKREFMEEFDKMKMVG